MTYTNIDWRGLTAGVDRIAQNNRAKYQADTAAETSRYTADTQAGSARYTADSNAAASKYKVDEETKRTEAISKAERESREKVAELDREARKEVAKLEVLGNITGQSVRIMPDIIPLFFTNGGGKGGNGNTGKYNTAANSPSKEELMQMIFKEDKLNALAKQGTLPTTRVGLGTLESNKEVPTSDYGGVNAVTVWNAFKGAFEHAGPYLAAGATAALTALKFAF